MNIRVVKILTVVLYIAAALLAFKIYRVIMEPIEFEKLKNRRYANVITKLEQIREVQLAYKAEFGRYSDDLESLIAFVDTGSINIIERKDSSFMYYNELYQTDMNKDTVIIRVLGKEPVKTNLFSEDFDVSSLRHIPHSNQVPFEMDAAFVQRQGVRVPVFEVKASNEHIFHDKIDEYGQFFDKNYSLIIGSLEEPKVSGNWR